MSEVAQPSPELQALLDRLCVYCGRKAEGNYAVHRDGFGRGPEVPLCDGCGSDLVPTLEDIWARISEA